MRAVGSSRLYISIKGGDDRMLLVDEITLFEVFNHSNIFSGTLWGVLCSNFNTSRFRWEVVVISLNFSGYLKM